jgi:hypothetical protein
VETTDNNDNKMVMGMNQKAKNSYIDKRLTKEQLERRKLIKGRLFEYDDDEDIDFTIPTKTGLSPIRGGKPKAGKILSLKRNTKPKAQRPIDLSNTNSSEDLQTMRGQSRIRTEMEPEDKRGLSPSRGGKPKAVKMPSQKRNTKTKHDNRLAYLILNHLRIWKR